MKLKEINISTNSELCTIDPNDFRKFAELKMNINDLLAFVDELKIKYEKKMVIISK